MLFSHVLNTVLKMVVMSLINAITNHFSEWLINRVTSAWGRFREQ